MAHLTAMEALRDGDMSLPQFQIGNGLTGLSNAFGLMQTGWAALINPIISRVQNQSSLILVDDSVTPVNQNGIQLAIGSNIIRHKLNRKIVGWKVIGQNSGASIYDSQASNNTPEITLVLVSDAVVTIKLEVF